jgi:hypothetical protein
MSAAAVLHITLAGLRLCMAALATQSAQCALLTHPHPAQLHNPQLLAAFTPPPSPSPPPQPATIYDISMTMDCSTTSLHTGHSLVLASTPGAQWRHIMQWPQGMVVTSLGWSKQMMHRCSSSSSGAEGAAAWKEGGGAMAGAEAAGGEGRMRALVVCVMHVVEVAPVKRVYRVVHGLCVARVVAAWDAMAQNG